MPFAPDALSAAMPVNPLNPSPSMLIVPALIVMFPPLPAVEKKKLIEVGWTVLHCRSKSKIAMPVAQLTLEIRIEHAQSLKDRRQVVRSLRDQLKQSFNVSVAELDEAVTWQSATLGVAAISRSRDYLHGLIEEVERAARRMTTELGAELTDSFWEYLES